MPSNLCIVLAVYRPDPHFLQLQLASLAAQTRRDFLLVLVIADTTSQALAEDLATAAGLPFVTVLPGQELDSVRAFEAGLRAALAQTAPDGLIALCDQDDVWHPDRLARGAAVLAAGPADLVHSDARLIDAEGRVTHPSMFRFERRQRHPGRRDLLYRNAVTGMTILMRRRLAALALPFPRQSGLYFHHDLWLALLAAAQGGVAFIAEPLVDYRQHGANVIGAVDRGTKAPRRRLPLMTWARREAAGYAIARYLALSVWARLAEAVQDGSIREGSARLRPLRPFLRRLRGAGMHFVDAARLLVTGHPDLARIAGGFGLVHLGRTAWALRVALGRDGLGAALSRFDTRLFGMAPGVQPAPLPGQLTGGAFGGAHTAIIDARKSARWTPDFTAPRPALTLLVPTLNPSEVFAGIATALDIGAGLAARGIPVRFIATDLPVASQTASEDLIRKRLPAGTDAARVSVHCGVTESSIPAHRDDRFLATAWWTAHVIDRLTRTAGFAPQPFLYLIQDFEPNFYPWGPEFADAMASYRFDFRPIFNTTTLRDHFAAEGFAFATPDAPAFRPSIDIAAFATPPRTTLPGPRRLAVYGRPEVPRNMFPTLIEALAAFIETEGLTPREITVESIGLQHGPVTLPGGITLKSLGKLPEADYPAYLRATDLGLGLMYSPHPSHPPLEMAASGVRVVTNHFGAKDLSRLSAAILSADPFAPAVAAALSQAWHMPPVPDADRLIDLAALGMPLSELVDHLAATLHTLRGDAAE